NPQSFNRYAYVQNDPVNFVDPSGLKFMLACTIGNDCISTYTWASRYDEFEAFLRWIDSKERGDIGGPGDLGGGRGGGGPQNAQQTPAQREKSLNPSCSAFVDQLIKQFYDSTTSSTFGYWMMNRARNNQRMVGDGTYNKEMPNGP
ncbi:MAG TPA: hypothetical protein VMZ30_11825, partial [Pyrinomonadaceae bacterium]|nr:hypothetical protein [Pyrinomonadaceae bacterium]